MNATRIESREALDARLDDGGFLLFKHSPICPVSARAWQQYERFVSAAPGVASGWIQVIAERALSQAVAASAGVRHESPQALLFVGGTCVWHASHGGITAEALRAAWDAHAGAA